jgi:hypothetical protein
MKEWAAAGYPGGTAEGWKQYLIESGEDESVWTRNQKNRRFTGIRDECVEYGQQTMLTEFGAPFVNRKK